MDLIEKHHTASDKANLKILHLVFLNDLAEGDYVDAVYTEKLLGLNKQTLCYCSYDKVSISYMQLFWLHCKQFKHVTCKECNQTGATSAINDTSAFDVQECLIYRFNPIGQCYMYSIDFRCCLCACLLFSVSNVLS